MHHPCHLFVELGSGCELPSRYTGNKDSGVMPEWFPVVRIVHAVAEGL
jgi:hypothetical protein